ncbi:MAG: TolC family protein, partial [Rhodopirellula sp. JB053]
AELPPAPIPTASRDIQVGILADLLRRRPDIRRSERLMRAQSERIGIAEADLYPRISLIGSFEWQAEDIDDLFDSQSVFGLISPGFSWNILNYGRISNSIELERQKFCEAVLQYQESVLIAQQEVEDALVGFLKAQEQVEKLSEAVGNVNEAEEIAVTLYRTGATDFNRVFLIQSIQFSQQDQLVVARANETLNLIKVYRANFRRGPTQRTSTIPCR